MAAIENEHVYGLQIRESANDGSDFTNPDADYRLVYLGEDGEWHKKDSAGAVTDFAGSGIAETLLDAAGDIIYASAADTAARLAAGASGTVLRSAGVAPPVWAVAANRHGCLVYHNTTQTVNAAVIPMNSELDDTDAYHDTVTNNSRITIPAGLGGLYLIEFGTSGLAVDGEFVRVTKNSGNPISTNWGVTNNGYITGMCVAVLAAVDYIEAFFTGNRTLGHASAYEAQSHFSAYLIAA